MLFIQRRTTGEDLDAVAERLEAEDLRPWGAGAAATAERARNTHKKVRFENTTIPV
jgi:acyl dehydratase